MDCIEHLRERQDYPDTIVVQRIDLLMLEYFEQRGGLTLESHDGLLLFYRAKKRCKPFGMIRKCSLKSELSEL